VGEMDDTFQMFDLSQDKQIALKLSSKEYHLIICLFLAKCEEAEREKYI